MEMGAGLGLELAVDDMWCTVPNSPGENVNDEQKPSEDVMTSVRPSADLGKSQ